MNILISIALLVAMLACVALIPLGLPGLWMITALVLVLALAGKVSWTVGLGAVGATVVAELAELLILRRLGAAYGGSSRAFWGAVVGGMMGLFVGTPVPVVGSVAMAFVGTFVGAGAVTWLETRSFGRSARVGWGVLVARSLAVGVKVATAMALIGVIGVLLLVS